MTLTKHAFLEGMGLGVLAGAAVGMAVAAKGMQDPNVRRMVRQTGLKVCQTRHDMADTLGM